MKYFLGLVLIIAMSFCSTEKKETGIVQASAQAAVDAPKPATIKTTAPVHTTAQASVNNQGEYKPKNEGWHVELEKAYAESKATGKPIMANFTGSDWCGWCKRLDASVFHQPGFKSWADEHVVLLELDFPRRFRLPDHIAQQNRGLQQSLGVSGYPTIWLFDMDKTPEGQLGIIALGRTGYTRTIDEFQSTIEQFIAQRKG